MADSRERKGEAMPVDPQIQALLDRAAGVPSTHTLPVAAARTQAEARVALMAPPAEVAGTREQTIDRPGGQLRLRLYTPRDDAQAAVDRRRQIILAHRLSNNPDDHAALVPLISALSANTGRKPADARPGREEALRPAGFGCGSAKIQSAMKRAHIANGGGFLRR